MKTSAARTCQIIAKMPALHRTCCGDHHPLSIFLLAPPHPNLRLGVVAGRGSLGQDLHTGLSSLVGSWDNCRNKRQCLLQSKDFWVLPPAKFHLQKEGPGAVALHAEGLGSDSQPCKIINYRKKQKYPRGSKRLGLSFGLFYLSGLCV